MNRITPFILVLVCVGLGLAVAGCGSSDSSTARTTTSDNSIASKGSSKPNREFLIPGAGSKQLAVVGEEASLAEREAAFALLEENSEARATKDFAKQCSSLARQPIERLEAAVRGLKVEKGCANSLRRAAHGVPQSVLANEMDGQLGALRVLKPNEAYALYHGNDGLAYYVLMIREDGKWLVGALLPTKLGGQESKQ
jgi:hypothetical protein